MNRPPLVGLDDAGQVVGRMRVTPGRLYESHDCRCGEVRFTVPGHGHPRANGALFDSRAYAEWWLRECGAVVIKEVAE